MRQLICTALNRPRGVSIPGDTARWTVSVSKDTDAQVREHLEPHARKRGDLSKFIEDAVRWRVFDQTLAEARAGFADMPPEALQALIDEAVTAVRGAKTRERG